MEEKKSLTDNYLKYLTLIYSNEKVDEFLNELLESKGIKSEKEIKKIKKFLGYSGKINIEEKDFRDNNILNFIISYSGEYSTEEIAKIFEVDKRTIINILNDFEKRKNIKSKSRKKKLIVEEIDNEISKIATLNYSKEEIRKNYLIYSILVFGDSVKREKLIKSFLNDFTGDFFKNNKENSSELSKKSYLDRLIRELITEGRLIEEDSLIKIPDNKFKNIDKETLEDLLIYIGILKEIHPKKAIYKRIYEKLRIINKEKSNQFIKTNERAGLSIYDEDKVNLIEKALKEDRFIKFKYKSSKDKGFKLHLFLIPLGIIYSYHNDLWYLEALEGKGKKQQKNIYRLDSLYELSIMDIDHLMKRVMDQGVITKLKVKKGKTIKSFSKVKIEKISYEKNKDLILLEGINLEDNSKINFHYHKIIDLDVVNKERKHYFNKEIYENALGVNAGKAKRVKVKFEREEFIERKLKIYQKERKSAKVKIEKDFFILEDEVSGITEFKAWVKSFGKSAYCISPKSLNLSIKEDLKLLKERFKDE